MTQNVEKSSRLRQLLQQDGLTFLMEAHSAISAKIAEEVGFEALWASGLSISASMGLADRNEASWSQVLDVVEFMTDHTEVPILMDGDNGFGNYNNVRRLVKKLCQRGVAGVCIEDKVFPKKNSFLGSDQQLTHVDEFVGKIRAAKDSQLHDSFCVVARTEALVAGRSVEEALTRAECYANAGADAIFIHSAEKSGDDVIRFAKCWAGKPIVIAPTKYCHRRTEDFRIAGISAVIWANHSLRASIAAMRDIAAAVRTNESVSAVESRIASLEDIFRLTTEPEARRAEIKYGQAEMTEESAMAVADFPQAVVAVSGRD